MNTYRPEMNKPPLNEVLNVQLICSIQDGKKGTFTITDHWKRRKEAAAVLSTSQMYFLQQHLESNQSHSHQSVPHTDTTSGYSSALPHRWLFEVICQKKSCAHQ